MSVHCSSDCGYSSWEIPAQNGTSNSVRAAIDDPGGNQQPRIQRPALDARVFALSEIPFAPELGTPP
ncbi:hypothetical protein VTN02DRAFT_1647 [Thermoascus thermophilus]